MSTYPGFRGPDLGEPPDEPDPEPERTYWTVVWDWVGGDCGDLPGECSTEAEAIAYGEDWVAMQITDPFVAAPPEGEGSPTYHVVRHVVHPGGGETVYNEEDEEQYTLSPEGHIYRKGKLARSADPDFPSTP